MPGITRKETTIDTAFENESEKQQRITKTFSDLRKEAKEDSEAAAIIRAEVALTAKLLEDE